MRKNNTFDMFQIKTAAMAVFYMNKNRNKFDKCPLEIVF